MVTRTNTRAFVAQAGSSELYLYVAIFTHSSRPQDDGVRYEYKYVWVP